MVQPLQDSTNMTKENLNIAIVCGHFIPDIGYIEEQLAKAFSFLEHNTHVFTTNQISPSVKHILDGKQLKEGTETNNIYGYSITRLPVYFKLGQMVKSNGLFDALKKLEPDIIVVIGLGKLFPIPILDFKCGQSKLIVLLNDNEDSFSIEAGIKGVVQSIKKYILRTFFKNIAYIAAVKYADKFITYTPSTIDIVKTYIPISLHKIFLSKTSKITLGYDHLQFYYDKSVRKTKRSELNLNDQSILICTATRITKFKNIERMVEIVSGLMEEGYDINYVIAGFGNDTYNKTLRKQIESHKHSNRITCLPFQDHKSLFQLFNAADIGFWSIHIITQYMAMGTGLPVILPNKKYLENIIIETKNGFLYSENGEGESLKQTLENINLNKFNREELASYNKSRYSFQTIAKQIITSVDL